MKPQKSPGNEEVTPSKKVLKQARLPFQILSETSPKPDAVSTRKRKLSAPEHQPVTKIGKITKESESLDPVIVSDEDREDDTIELVAEENVIKNINPFVKIVDTAFKKKQKSKTAKNKKCKKNEHTGHACKNKVSENEMDVDKDENTDTDQKSSKSPKVNNKERTGDNEKTSDIITLDDSNDSVVSSKDKKRDEVLNKSDCEEAKKEDESLSKKDSKTPSPVTPRRTPRRKVENGKKSLNMSQTTDDSGSSQNTPNRNTRSSSVVKSEGDVSITENSITNTTPKQVQKQLDHAKKREEREKKKQQEKDEKERIKQEKEALRKKEKEEKEDAKRREREEKEEQKKKEREEKEKQKEFEKKLKEEKEEQKRKEREEKEEQKRKEKEAKDEEKKKKQEALELEKLEQEQKKKKAAEAFASFFVPKQKSDKDQSYVCLSKSDMLSNFTVKNDMRLAPAVRNPLTDERRKELDKFMENQNLGDLYIKYLRNGKYKPVVGEKTWPINEKDDDVLIIEDELPPIDGAGEIVSCDSSVREKLRPKLLSFHENRRPPYWGTWRKRSVFIKPRNPFSMDQKQLEYEVDSDEEWEEEEGESIEGSAAGSDDEGPDEYELDNEVFVPHGYLSDEEATMDDDDVMSLSPETQKARLKHLEDEFESELKKPTEKIKPRFYGLLWETENGKPENCVDALWNYFSKVSMIINEPPIMQPTIDAEGTDKKKVKRKKTSDVESKSPAEKKKEKKEKREQKESKQKNEKSQLGINAFLAKVKSS